MSIVIITKGQPAIVATSKKEADAVLQHRNGEDKRQRAAREEEARVAARLATTRRPTTKAQTNKPKPPAISRSEQTRPSAPTSRR